MVLPMLRTFSLVFTLVAVTLASPLLMVTDAHAAASEDEQEAALAFYKEMSDEAFAVLRDPSLNKQEQKVEFRRLFKKGTAVEQIGPLLLGFHRRKFSQEQLATYTDILPDYVVALYTDRLIEVGDEEVTILDTYTQGSNDVWIMTRVTSPFGGDDLRADWRIRRLKDGSFSLLDVKVENISLFQTKKDEFMSFISDRGVEKFLKRLKEDAEKSAA